MKKFKCKICGDKKTVSSLIDTCICKECYDYRQLIKEEKRTAWER